MMVWRLLTKRQRTELQMADMKMFRFSLGGTEMDRTRNESAEMMWTYSGEGQQTLWTKDMEYRATGEEETSEKLHGRSDAGIGRDGGRLSAVKTLKKAAKRRRI